MIITGVSKDIVKEQEILEGISGVEDKHKKEMQFLQLQMSGVRWEREKNWEEYGQVQK